MCILQTQNRHIQTAAAIHFKIEFYSILPCFSCLVPPKDLMIL